MPLAVSATQAARPLALRLIIASLPLGLTRYGMHVGERGAPSEPDYLS